MEKARWRVRLEVTLLPGDYGDDYPSTELEAVAAAIRPWEGVAVDPYHRSIDQRHRATVEVRRGTNPDGSERPWRRVRDWERWRTTRIGSESA